MDHRDTVSRPYTHHLYPLYYICFSLPSFQLPKHPLFEAVVLITTRTGSEKSGHSQCKACRVTQAHFSTEEWLYRNMAACPAQTPFAFYKLKYLQQYIVGSLVQERGKRIFLDAVCHLKRDCPALLSFFPPVAGVYIFTKDPFRLQKKKRKNAYCSQNCRFWNVTSSNMYSEQQIGLYNPEKVAGFIK